MFFGAFSDLAESEGVAESFGEIFERNLKMRHSFGKLWGWQAGGMPNCSTETVKILGRILYVWDFSGDR